METTKIRATARPQHRDHTPSGIDNLNPYARIIVDEALRRGIDFRLLDEETGYFSLTHNGRSIVCLESLSELTNAIAMSRCVNKRVTCRLLAAHGLRVPRQQPSGELEQDRRFLQRHRRIVVKPARGEQGAGISVDIDNEADMLAAIEQASKIHHRVLLEEFVQGEDLRVVVIDYEVVAAAVRRPPMVTGNGQDTVMQLIQQQSRRREQATGGESHIPLDAETRHCVRQYGWSLDSVLPAGEPLQVRKTDNLHTGATIEDVTASLHPRIRDAAVAAARAIKIPVVGVDFMLPAPDSEDYVILEANERPGLANHEPQPTAQRYIDLLFPETRSA